MSDADNARAYLRDFAFALHVRAADKHAEGIELSRSSAKIDQLADLVTDEQALRLRELLTEDERLPAVLEAIESNAPGGRA